MTDHVIINTSNLSNVDINLPRAFNFYQNYPNPFNPVTEISFDIPHKANVSIGIYDVTGRNIQTLVNDNYQPGYYSISWDGTGYSSGVYFVKMISEDFVDTQKLMLIK